MTAKVTLPAVQTPIAAVLARQLEQVTVTFEQQLASEMSAVNALCMHVEQYRGKMLRPTLVLLSGLAAAGEPCDGSRLTDKHRILAAVVEMIHMATLVHDDVLDDAQMRRGGATVNHLSGNETAVILGDYLISNAFHLCSTMGDPAINLALGHVTNTLCEGELVQLHHRNDYSIDEATYFEIVLRKTASLIGECCRLGALLSHADEKLCKTMHSFGTLLGIAFQIQDDLLDLMGEQRVVGKSLGKDLDKGKLTLPMIYCISSADQRERGEMLKSIAQRDAQRIRDRLLKNGAVERTVAAAHSRIEQAKSLLPEMPSSEARHLLASMADSMVARQS